MFKLGKSAAKWLNREDGNVTIEFVILFPVLMLVMGVAMDIGVMYYKKSQIHEAIQDVNRWRSIGAVADNTTAENMLDQLLAQGFSDEAVAKVSLRGALISTSVTVPLHDMQILGFFAGLVGDPNVVVGDQQFLESYSQAYYDPNSGWTPEDMTMVNGIIQTTNPLDSIETTTTTVTSTVF